MIGRTAEWLRCVGNYSSFARLALCRGFVCLANLLQCAVGSLTRPEIATIILKSSRKIGTGCMNREVHVGSPEKSGQVVMSRV